MGCGPSNSNKVLGENGGASEINAESMAARIGYPPGTAFTISFDDNTDDLVQKNPPKRLQRLETNRSLSSSSNIEELEEKLATAETRRQQFLSQRTNTKTKVLNLSQEIPEIEELQINTEEMDDHNVDSATIDIKYEDNDYDVIAKEM